MSNFIAAQQYIIYSIIPSRVNAENHFQQQIISYHNLRRLTGICKPNAIERLFQRCKHMNITKTLSVNI